VNLSPARTIQPFPTEAAAREFLHRLLPETNLLHLNAQRFLIGDFTSSSPSGASRLKYLGRFWGFPFSFQLGDGSGASTDSSEAPTSEDAKIAEGPSSLFIIVRSFCNFFYLSFEIGFSISSLIFDF
jgi:hypothetical protein